MLRQNGSNCIDQTLSIPAHMSTFFAVNFVVKTGVCFVGYTASSVPSTLSLQRGRSTGDASKL